MSDEKTERLSTGQWLSLDKYLQLTVVPINEKLSGLQSAIEKLAVESVKSYDLDSLRYQVASQSERLQELEKAIRQQHEKIESLEHFKKIALWAFGILSTLGLGLIARWLDALLFP